MTKEEYEKIPFHYKSHIWLGSQGQITFESEDGKFGICQVIMRNPHGVIDHCVIHYFIGDKHYQTEEAFLEALEEVPAMVEGNEKD